MRICTIFNPRAGNAENIKDLFLSLRGGDRCEVRAISFEHSAARLAREAVDDGFDRIIAAGGDGTVGDVINGIAPDFDAVEIGVLPLGTGNDLARSLGVSHDNTALACATSLDGAPTRSIDLIRVTAHGETIYCVNVAHAGLGGRVAADVRIGDKQRWGSMAYWMTSISKLVSMQPAWVKVDMDGKEVEANIYGLAIANGRFVGGGFPIAPAARLNDGLMDVTVIPVLPKIELMAAGLNFMLNRNHRTDRIRSYRGARIHVVAESELPFSIDGEPLRRLEGEFEIVPRALRVVAGRNAPGLSNIFEQSTVEGFQA